MQSLLKLSRCIDALNDWVGRAASWLVLVMVIVGSLNVIAGELGNIIHQKLTSNRYLETQWYLYAAVFLLGGAYTLKANEHVRVDLFYGNWPPKRKALANLLGSLLFLLPFCLLMLSVSWEPVLNSWVGWEQSPDPDGLPRAPVKSVLLVGFGLLALQGISEAIKSGAVLMGGESDSGSGIRSDLGPDLGPDSGASSEAEPFRTEIADPWASSGNGLEDDEPDRDSSEQMGGDR